MGLCKKEHEIHFQTDSRGFRNYTHNPEKPFDMIILGDSFGASSRTGQELIISSQLNRKGYHAYNMSIDAADPWMELVTFKYEMPKLKMTHKKYLIWLLFEGNDLIGGMSYSTDIEKLKNSKLCQILKSIEVYYKRSILRLAFKSVFLETAKKRRKKLSIVRKKFFDKEMLFFNTGYWTSLTPDKLRQNENYHNLRRVFEDMNKFTKKNNFQVLCVMVPLKSRIYEWVYNEKMPWTSYRRENPFADYIEELTRENGMYYIDLTPVMIDASKRLYEENRETVYWLGDGHWNNKGIAVAVSAIDDFLKTKTE